MTIFPFISVTARVASSGELKATNPEPLEAPKGSLMILQEMMVPNSLKSSLSWASSTVSL
eukprot:CAMPEP_0182615384 /NCGR_PEP_ID=MMETSP1330-20130603/34512_1 /TAXON_ID=464278 /ORGANISM="Picochlorum sp., Strain RCC944" /LENGTH=59 /DNA_ID=CAMNT_0024835307 /DNA_START=165 /DNA_END=341 /DNA_ORIENTATION=-